MPEIFGKLELQVLQVGQGFIKHSHLQDIDTLAEHVSDPRAQG